MRKELVSQRRDVWQERLRCGVGQDGRKERLVHGHMTLFAASTSSRSVSVLDEPGHTARVIPAQWQLQTWDAMRETALRAVGKRASTQGQPPDAIKVGSGPFETANLRISAAGWKGRQERLPGISRCVFFSRLTPFSYRSRAKPAKEQTGRRESENRGPPSAGQQPSNPADQQSSKPASSSPANQAPGGDNGDVTHTLAVAQRHRSRRPRLTHVVFVVISSLVVLASPLFSSFCPPLLRRPCSVLSGLSLRSLPRPLASPFPCRRHASTCLTRTLQRRWRPRRPPGCFFSAGASAGEPPRPGVGGRCFLFSPFPPTSIRPAIPVPVPSLVGDGRRGRRSLPPRMLATQSPHSPRLTTVLAPVTCGHRVE